MTFISVANRTFRIYSSYIQLKWRKWDVVCKSYAIVVLELSEDREVFQMWFGTGLPNVERAATFVEEEVTPDAVAVLFDVGVSHIWIVADKVQILIVQLKPARLQVHWPTLIFSYSCIYYPSWIYSHRIFQYSSGILSRPTIYSLLYPASLLSLAYTLPSPVPAHYSILSYLTPSTQSLSTFKFSLDIILRQTLPLLQPCLIFVE